MDIYHRCGKQIIMNSESHGTNFLTEFYDPKVKDHAEKITFCPGCGEPLGKMHKPKEQVAAVSSVGY